VVELQAVRVDAAVGEKGAEGGLKEVPSISDLRTLRQSTSFLADEDNVRTVLVWQNLTVTTPIRGSNERKVLLDSVSGSMTGGMWAVMGPSGCGKSTLLNTLACRLDVNTTVEGEMRLNGRPYQNAELKKMSGYVMQVSGSSRVIRRHSPPLPLG
jgi:ABC-type transport system involved in cytochrome bd biosynthesis fused ATPase/permease subunit